jgi:uncharacterized protein YodC (DUF2158 family)
MNLAIGDVVRLKSGGELMTVEKVDDQIVQCIWQRIHGEINRERFLLATLSKATVSVKTAA